MEGVVARFRDALNYSYWCLGALHLLAARNLPTPLLDMEEQLFKAVRLALNDACKDSTYVIGNLRSWRREAYLSHLRPSFSQVEKGILRKSPIFTPLLFDEERLQEALQSAKDSADLALHEAAVKALARPRPNPGPSLTKRGSRPSSSAAGPPAPSTRRPSFPSCTRDSRSGPLSTSSTHSSLQRGGRRGKPFRK